MTLLKIIIKITHLKTKPAVGYLLFSFSFIVVRRNGGVRISFSYSNLHDMTNTIVEFAEVGVQLSEWWVTLHFLV